MMIAVAAWAQDAAKLIPVSKFPATVTYGGKTYYNASADICVKAGYRLIPVKPVTPEGKQIVSEKFVQNDKKPECVKYEIVYEDIPVKPTPPPYVPPVLTNVAAERVQFKFTTNGTFYGATWLDAPATNQ
jgi:hypothetical protein